MSEHHLREVARALTRTLHLARALGDQGGELDELRERADRVIGASIPGPRPDGRVGPWPDALIAEGLAVLNALLQRSEERAKRMSNQLEWPI